MTPEDEQEVLGDGSVEYTIVDLNDGNFDLTNAHTDVFRQCESDGTPSFVATLATAAAKESGTDDNILSDGETFTWTFNTGALTEDCDFWFFAHGNVTIAGTTYDVTSNDAANHVHGDEIIPGGDADEAKHRSMTVFNPSSDMNVSPSATQEVFSGDSFDYTIVETNDSGDGNTALTNAHVDVLRQCTSDGSPVLQTTLTAAAATESGTNDDILSDGETFTWNFNTGAITELCSFWFFAHGNVTIASVNYDVTADDPVNHVHGTLLADADEAAHRDIELVGCALSPGFWQGGSGVSMWDNIANDPIAQAAGFDTGTVFPWLDPSISGLTYLEVMALPTHGDVTIQMSFKYIASKLNFALLPIPDISPLLTDVETYFASHPVGSNPTGADKQLGKELFAQLNNYFSTVGENFCPSPDEIPEGQE